MSDIVGPHSQEIKEMLEAMGLDHVISLDISMAVDRIPEITVRKFATARDIEAITQVFQVARLIDASDGDEETRPA